MTKLCGIFNVDLTQMLKDINSKKKLESNFGDVVENDYLCSRNAVSSRHHENLSSMNR